MEDADFAPQNEEDIASFDYNEDPHTNELDHILILINKWQLSVKQTVKFGGGGGIPQEKVNLCPTTDAYFDSPYYSKA